jgi:beta-xylosidase
VRAVQHGWATCPTKSVPAGAVENYLREQVTQIADEVGPEFVRLWNSFSMTEQNKHLPKLIERIEYDGRSGSMAIRFDQAGLEELVPSGKELAPCE